jgi:hypothetical protein
MVSILPCWAVSEESAPKHFLHLEQSRWTCRISSQASCTPATIQTAASQKGRRRCQDSTTSIVNLRERGYWLDLAIFISLLILDRWWAGQRRGNRSTADQPIDAANGCFSDAALNWSHVRPHASCPPAPRPAHVWTTKRRQAVGAVSAPCLLDRDLGGF